MTSKAWTEPESAANANEDKFRPIYPYTTVTYTDSGHMLLFNDTPGNECIRLQHRKESFLEFHPNGDIVVKANTGNNYVIISSGNNNLHVNGDYNITVTKDHSVNINKNYNKNIDGDCVERVKGTVVKTFDGMVNYTAKDEISITSEGSNIILTVSDGQEVTVNGKLQVNGDVNVKGNISAQGNVTANESIFGMVSLKTLGCVNVGPSAAVSASVPIPGMIFCDMGVDAEMFFRTKGTGKFGGIVTCMDTYYTILGTSFSRHVHSDPQGGVVSTPS